jgi:CheY-like chemotaxis protein
LNIRKRNRPIEILHVEDSNIDAQLTRIALKEISVEHRVHLVVDGDEAMEFLFQKGDYEDAPRPDLILLDLNLPAKDGHEVLAEIRADPTLKPLVVVVLTSSANEEDVSACYQLNCNAYLTKQMSVKDLIVSFEAISQFFFQVAILPTES